MKKLLMVLTSIALIVVIGAASVFGYSSFKSLTDNKEVSKKKEDKKENKENKDQENTNEEVTQQQDQTQEVNNNEQQEQVNTENQELNPNEEIAKADKDGDGVATIDEITPELEELARQGKFQPTSRKMYYQDEELEEDTDNSSEDEDMSEAYERQKEMYEKAAKGDVPEPGEGPITEE